MYLINLDPNTAILDAFYIETLTLTVCGGTIKEISRSINISMMQVQHDASIFWG